jgi:hypothetical protein
MTPNTGSPGRPETSHGTRPPAGAPVPASNRPAGAPLPARTTTPAGIRPAGPDRPRSPVVDLTTMVRRGVRFDTPAPPRSSPEGLTASPSGPSRSAGLSGGVAAGLVQRVQRRLAAAGAVAADADGLRAAVADALGDEGILLAPASFAATVRAIGDELTGLGPLAPLLADPTVTDVLVNGPSDIWVERDGRIERAAAHFPSAAAVAAMVQRVVAPLGLRVDESRPWVDARLPGGERFHAVLPPLAPDGPVVTIRTFARRRLRLVDLIERDALDAVTARLLEAMVAAGIAIAVSGATGTGKTTLLNVSERHSSLGLRERSTDPAQPVYLVPRIMVTAGGPSALHARPVKRRGVRATAGRRGARGLLWPR